MPSGVPGYRGLAVWDKAHRATILTLDLVAELPKTSGATRIIDQLVGSVSSIGANIAEGYPSREGGEYRRYLNIALASAYETDNWLQVLKDSAIIARHISPEKVKEIEQLNIEVIKMLRTVIKSIEQKRKGGSGR
jgi:four helix bundle protein